MTRQYPTNNPINSSKKNMELIGDEQEEQNQDVSAVDSVFESRVKNHSRDGDSGDDDDDGDTGERPQQGDYKSSFYDYYRTETGRMPRQWLADRCDGKSYNNTTERPSTRAFWPPVPIKWCPDILEQNCLCEGVGALGCASLAHQQQQQQAHQAHRLIVTQRRRRRIFQFAFAINVIGLILMVVTTMAISKEYFDLIWNISFSDVRLHIIQGPQDYDTAAYFHLGLRAAAIESQLLPLSEDDSSLEDGQVIHTFDEFCNLLVGAQQEKKTAAAAATNVLLSYQKGYDCNGCNDVSHKIVPSLFLSMLSYIPNFTTDVVRMWSTYDVNCQKFMGSVFSWVSLITAIYTWVNYRNGCFDTLNTEPFALNENLERIDDENGQEEDIYMIVVFTWNAGVGQICLAVASLLKIVDIFLNCLVPTPTITRDHAEQVEYEWTYGKRRKDTIDDQETRSLRPSSNCLIETPDDESR